MDRSVEKNDLVAVVEEDLSCCSARNNLMEEEGEGACGVLDEAFDEALHAAMKQDMMKAVDVRTTNLLRQPLSTSFLSMFLKLWGECSGIWVELLGTLRSI